MPETPTGPRRRHLSNDEYFQGVRSGDVAILARALTLVESSHPRHQQQAEELLTRLLPFAGQAIRVGITGAPGAGKSTFIESVGRILVSQGYRIAVLAVDPSSGLTGGSILADKTRMAGLSADPNAYIRPCPSAGTLGGVARKTRESMFVCEAAGYQIVLVETVGVGQSETMVADMTDCFLALLLPGGGDELQGIKRGLLELVDVIAVNKADGESLAAAELTAQQYSRALRSLASRTADEGPPPVLTCSALHNTGVQTVWDVIRQRFDRLKASGCLSERRRRQNLRWLWSIVDEQLRRAVQVHPQVQAIRPELERLVLQDAIPVEAAARRILHAFGLDLN